MSFAGEMACIIRKTILLALYNGELCVAGGKSPHQKTAFFFFSEVRGSCLTSLSVLLINVIICVQPTLGPCI